jgi:hypothetical protein
MMVMPVTRLLRRVREERREQRSSGPACSVHLCLGSGADRAGAAIMRVPRRPQTPHWLIVRSPFRKHLLMLLRLTASPPCFPLRLRKIATSCGVSSANLRLASLSREHPSGWRGAEQGRTGKKPARGTERELSRRDRARISARGKRPSPLRKWCPIRSVRRQSASVQSSAGGAAVPPIMGRRSNGRPILGCKAAAILLRRPWASVLH